ncbi:hypothetical protein EKL30_13320 [Candidimonas sp. SYP-B2681]|uniref:TssQ family T6SS-associated lipoprotein n=1 Tax=Candidimonas sp. SYP-B2681 TaxID=2497686 RepID=UPI000F873A44|nr:TssQ family T6SS-associated lipoprotein [Candidimonas sp. SYP-B2681]RTZ41548.1 hypothetical protein EKL30_13320 [Candidimonas sp. SYP-B2681]
MKLYVALVGIATCLNLVSCAQRPIDGPAVTRAQSQAIEEVRLAYEAGRYAEVAQRVGLSVDLQTAPPALHLEALKLQAFSYCLLNDTGRCKQSFNRLLNRYPTFDLAAAERQHPMWGPVFQQAKVDAGK